MPIAKRVSKLEAVVGLRASTAWALVNRASRGDMEALRVVADRQERARVKGGDDACDPDIAVAFAALPPDVLVEFGVRHGVVHELPPALQEMAGKRVGSLVGQPVGCAYNAQPPR